MSDENPDKNPKQVSDQGKPKLEYGKLDDIVRQSRELEKKMDNLSSSLLALIISILGIFLATSFVLNSTVQILSNLFEDFGDFTLTDLGYFMFAGGMYLFIIFMLSTGILEMISRLVESRSLVKKDNKTKDKSENKPSWVGDDYIGKHFRKPVYWFSGITIFFGFIICIISHLFTFRPERIVLLPRKMSLQIASLFSFDSLLIVVVILLIAALVICLVKLSKKDK
jgi:hypothetical protein